MSNAGRAARLGFDTRTLSESKGFVAVPRVASEARGRVEKRRGGGVRAVLFKQDDESAASPARFMSLEKPAAISGAARTRPRRTAAA
jgi:hypothetical protein